MADGDLLDVVELFFQYNLTGDPEAMFTSLAVHVDVDFGLAEAQGCLTDWGFFMNGFAPSVYTIGPGYAEQWVEGEANVVYPGISVVQGTDAEPATPQNTSFLVRKIGTSPGRANQGRMFIPGVGEENVDANGLLPGALVEAMQSALDAWGEAVGTDRHVLGAALVHAAPAQFIPGPPIENPAFPGIRFDTAVQRLQVQFQAATQRRRMRR